MSTGELAAFFNSNAESRLIALQEAHDACDKLTAPAGGERFSQGWIVAREKCLSAIRDLMT